MSPAFAIAGSWDTCSTDSSATKEWNGWASASSTPMPCGTTTSQQLMFHRYVTSHTHDSSYVLVCTCAVDTAPSHATSGRHVDRFGSANSCCRYRTRRTRRLVRNCCSASAGAAPWLESRRTMLPIADSAVRMPDGRRFTGGNGGRYSRSGVSSSCGSPRGRLNENNSRASHSLRQ